MKNKKFLFISLLILAIGFAAVSTTLYISGNFKTGEYIDTITFCSIGTHERNTINIFTDIQEQ